MRNILFVFVLVAAAACGKKGVSSSDSGKVASCNSTAMHACVEYHEANLALGSDLVAKTCNVVDKDAVFSMTACPAKPIGTCQRNEGKDYYYEGYVLADQIEKDCAGQGGKYAK